MIPILFEAGTTSFTTNGMGRLSDALQCRVEEAINGAFELEMVYPVDGIHYADLKEMRIIYAIHDDTKEPEPFEIYRISRPINRKVTINAWQISYIMRKKLLNPFTAETSLQAVNQLNTQLSSSTGFTFSSQFTNEIPFEVEVPTAARVVMGNIVETFGGEWEYKKFTCTLKARRGSDTGVSIRYGKNMTDIEKTTDLTGMWTGVLPYWKGRNSNQEDVVVYADSPVYIPSHAQYPYEMIIAADASGTYDSPPSQSSLRTWGEAYVAAQALSAIPVSIEIKFVALWQTEEYKDIAALQRLQIGDSMHVYYNELGVDNVARIVEYEYDVLGERYESMTLGHVEENFTQKLKDDIQEAVRNVPTVNFVQAAIDHATDLIKGGLGGRVILNTDAAGHPNEILIMDTDSTATAVNVIRINMAGIGFSTSGYNGPFTTAWTIDGHFVADFITAGTLNAALIKAGILSDASGNNTWDMTSGALSIKKGSINLGNGNFVVTDAGVVTIKNGSIQILSSDGTKNYFSVSRTGVMKATEAELTGNIVFHPSASGSALGYVDMNIRGSQIYLNEYGGLGWTKTKSRWSGVKINMQIKTAGAKDFLIQRYENGSAVDWIYSGGTNNKDLWIQGGSHYGYAVTCGSPHIHFSYTNGHLYYKQGSSDTWHQLD